MNKTYKNILILVVASQLLTACSTYKYKFSSKPDVGLGSTSPYEIKELIDSSDLEYKLAKKQKKPRAKKSFVKYEGCKTADNKYTLDYLLERKKFIKLYIPDFFDENGDYNLGREIISKLDDSRRG